MHGDGFGRKAALSHIMVIIEWGHAPAVLECHVDVAQATGFTIVTAARLAETSTAVELCSQRGQGGCKLSMPTGAGAGVRAASRREVSVLALRIAGAAGAGAAGTGMSAGVGTTCRHLFWC